MTVTDNLQISRRRLLRLLPALGAGLLWSQGAAGSSFDDFFRAVRFDDDRRVAALIQRGMDPNTVEETRGESALMVAIREESNKVIKLLLNARDFNPEVRARNGDTALMMAAFMRRRDVVQALLAKGAQVNQVGWTALHYAAASGDVEIVRMLLDKHAYIDAASPNKTTPLMMAARGGHIMVVKLLHDEGADATLKNEADMSAIDFARMGEFKDIVEGLTYRLKRAGQLQ